MRMTDAVVGCAGGVPKGVTKVCRMGVPELKMTRCAIRAHPRVSLVSGVPGEVCQKYLCRTFGHTAENLVCRCALLRRDVLVGTARLPRGEAPLGGASQ